METLTLEKANLKDYELKYQTQCNRTQEKEKAINKLNDSIQEMTNRFQEQVDGAVEDKIKVCKENKALKERINEM